MRGLRPSTYGAARVWDRADVCGEHSVQRVVVRGGGVPTYSNVETATVISTASPWYKTTSVTSAGAALAAEGSTCAVALAVVVALVVAVAVNLPSLLLEPVIKAADVVHISSSAESPDGLPANTLRSVETRNGAERVSE